MTLLNEFILTPDVFDTRYCPHEEASTERLERLKEVFMKEALLRNLHGGEWLNIFKTKVRPWHKLGTEIIKKMSKQNRLRTVDPEYSDCPKNDVEWCEEALESHRRIPANGVITTDYIENKFDKDQSFIKIERLDSSPQWKSRKESVRLLRSYENYEEQLRLIMNTANSIMFIDPHLDPSKNRYADILKIILLAQNRRPKPTIEIHRVVYRGSGKKREIIDKDDWEKIFHNNWSEKLISAGLQIDIYIWKDFHDRYLISDLIGIEMSNGFDTSTDPNEKTTWGRIDREDKYDIEREFDAGCNPCSLKYSFSIPKIND